jgi:hypothetical protein
MDLCVVSVSCYSITILFLGNAADTKVEDFNSSEGIMQAARIHKFGGPEGIKVDANVPIPKLADTQAGV